MADIEKILPDTLEFAITDGKQYTFSLMGGNTKSFRADLDTEPDVKFEVYVEEGITSRIYATTDEWYYCVCHQAPQRILFTHASNVDVFVVKLGQIRTEIEIILNETDESFSLIVPPGRTFIIKRSVPSGVQRVDKQLEVRSGLEYTINFNQMDNYIIEGLNMLQQYIVVPGRVFVSLPGGAAQPAGEILVYHLKEHEIFKNRFTAEIGCLYSLDIRLGEEYRIIATGQSTEKPPMYVNLSGNMSYAILVNPEDPYIFKGIRSSEVISSDNFAHIDIACLELGQMYGRRMKVGDEITLIIVRNNGIRISVEADQENNPLITKTTEVFHGRETLLTIRKNEELTFFMDSSLNLIPVVYPAMVRVTVIDEFQQTDQSIMKALGSLSVTSGAIQKSFTQ